MRYFARSMTCVAALLFVTSEAATAAPIFFISGLPSAYTPGDTLNFDIGITNDGTAISGYSVSLTAASTSGVAGTDFAFSATEAATNIFFGAPLPFGSPFTSVAGTGVGIVELTIGDFDLGASYTGTADTILANVSLTTTANAGDLTIAFNASSPTTYTPTPPGFPPPPPRPTVDVPSGNLKYFNDQGQEVSNGSVTVVPEPGAMGLAWAGMLGLAVGCRRRRRKSNSTRPTGNC
ncbi:MAG: hypothetical protein RIK87_19925 [Fuerstiella sp.]